MLIIPTEGELFPEWRIMFVIAYPGEDNFYQIEIVPDDIEKIKASERWVIIDNQHFNKDMCESFRFITQVKDGSQWKTYSPELVTEILKKELEEEMKKQLQSLPGNETLPSGITSMDKLFDGMMNNSTVHAQSFEDAIKHLSSNKNRSKTGR